MGANELFFQSCAMRANKLPPAKQALVQMQVSQILYQAETSPSVHMSSPAPHQPKANPIDANNGRSPTQNQGHGESTTSMNDWVDILSSATRCIFEDYQQL